jgi:hypothetical protein
MEMRFRYRLSLSLIAGFAAFIAFFPFMGQDSDPPKHFSVFTYQVPTDNLLFPLVMGVGGGLLVWLVTGSRNGARK